MDGAIHESRGWNLMSHPRSLIWYRPPTPKMDKGITKMHVELSYHLLLVITFLQQAAEIKKRFLKGFAFIGHLAKSCCG